MVYLRLLDAGPVTIVFRVGMMISLPVAFLAAYPVNRYLLQKNVLDRQCWATRQELRLAVVTRIEKT